LRRSNPGFQRKGSRKKPLLINTLDNLFRSRRA
jgi:hypothetical protein